MKGTKSYQTFVLYDKDGKQITVLWTRRTKLKDEILDYLTARQFIDFDYAVILNRKDDTSDHRPIKKADLFKE